MSNSDLTALANIISSNVQSLQEGYSANGITFPSLNDPFNPTPLDFDPKLMRMKSLIIAAASQLIASVGSPLEILLEQSLSMYLTATLGFVVDNHIPEILNEGGSQGVHVKDISAKTGVDFSYIARVLRFLATRHVFREIAPDVFTNNRLSSIASKPLTLKEIKADPESCFDNAPVASNLSHFANEAFTSSVHLSEFLQNPKKAVSAFNIAFGTEARIWEWYGFPGNEWRGKKFANAMKGGAERWPTKLFVDGIGVNDLRDNDLVVDVGGNVGSCTLPLYKANPKLRYVVQDLSSVIATAPTFWHEHAPQAISSGNVIFQSQDFFQPQATKDAAVYFLRLVLHDWSDKESKIILKHLREAANKSSKLVLFDFVSHHVCETTSSFSAVTRPSAPSPLLANLGIANGGFDTAIDIQMLNICDGKHRLEEEWQDIGLSSGWKLENIIEGPLSVLTFSPA